MLSRLLADSVCLCLPGPQRLYRCRNDAVGRSMVCYKPVIPLNRAFISSSGLFAVSGSIAQKNSALVKVQITNVRKNCQPTLCMAIGVVCPINVLNARETITPIDTPLDRVFVSNTNQE
jgi:hypothetical protein